MSDDGAAGPPRPYRGIDRWRLGRRGRLVADFEEGEAAGGGAVGGFAGVAFFALEEVFDFVETEAALGGLHGGSGEHADHLVEKAVADKGEQVAVGDGLEIAAGEGAVVFCFFAFVAALGGEMAEVVFAQKESERFCEGVGIELAGEVPDETGVEGGKDGGEGEAVLVGFFLGGKAGVEVGGGFFAIHHPDGGGKFAVEGGEVVEGVHRRVLGGVEVGDLAKGMHAGVGASGIVNADGLFDDFGEGGFEVILHGAAFGLAGPAEEGASVVGDGEFQAHSWKN